MASMIDWITVHGAFLLAHLPAKLESILLFVVSMDHLMESKLYSSTEKLSGGPLESSGRHENRPLPVVR